MRYCLVCRRAASSGPICSGCGRSFGGNLCSCKHLNPPGAQFCAQCGSTKLLQSAGSIAVGKVVGLLLLGGAVWWGGHLLSGAHWGEAIGRWLWAAYEWLLWKMVVIGSLLFFGWLFGDLFSPRIRRGIERLTGSLLMLIFKIGEKILVSLFSGITHLLGKKVKK